MGAEPVKTAQRTIKILEFHDLSPHLTHTFSLELSILGLFWLSCEGSRPTTEYKTTPLLDERKRTRVSSARAANRIPPRSSVPPDPSPVFLSTSETEFTTSWQMSWLRLTRPGQKNYGHVALTTSTRNSRDWAAGDFAWQLASHSEPLTLRRGEGGGGAGDTEVTAGVAVAPSTKQIETLQSTLLFWATHQYFVISCLQNSIVMYVCTGACSCYGTY